MTAAKKKEKKAPQLTESLYQAIQTPVITEKATLGSQYNQYTFRVPLTADKAQIRDAIEAVFKVKVVKVNTSVQLGKTKIFKGRKAYRSDRKKAIVTLEQGQTIDVSTGV
ncbi:MAG TPA: 50S ribosomal protein L23 [Patescibacteria group bacterium]|nr:50S ribosomal protein L23 [Patescibacteria group bacterium]